MSSVVLKAPVSGMLMPLERVPDPVFAQKMVGEGIAVDPLTQTLVAPCAGTVLQLHPAHHAVTIRTAHGLEILMHVGIDTIKLRGEGFHPSVLPGDSVSPGDTLIEFDADYVATHARSLLTIVLVTNPERVQRFQFERGRVEVARSTILGMELAPRVHETTSAEGETVLSEAVLLPNSAGLHARPAAVLAALARRYRSEIRLFKGERSANARSVVALLSLEVGPDDRVHLRASGPDSAEAVEALLYELRHGLGDEVPAPAPASTIPGALPPPGPRSDNPRQLLGVAASPGLAVGKLLRVEREKLKVPQRGDRPAVERRRLEEALRQANVALGSLQSKLHREAEPARAAIFAAHQELLSDPDLLDIAEGAISKGNSAAFAWQRAYSTHAERLASLPNQLVAARANDLRDVGERVLALITGQAQAQHPIPPETILVGEDLTPSETATLDRSRVVGFCTTAGGSTSHVAILARTLGIPAVAGIEARVLDLPDGTPAILNGTRGTLTLEPSKEQRERVRVLKARREKRRQADLEAAHAPAATTDGLRVEVAANVGGQAEAQEAVTLGAEAVGLLRSEFLFLERAVAPDEEEQLQAYRSVAETLGPQRPLIIRTLDVGGDKPLAYLPLPREDNPFLGMRGVRVLLDHPDLFRTQVRAVLRTSKDHPVRLMLPMVATLEEWRSARGLIEQEREKLGIEPIPLGIMVEVPAAALQAEAFAREVDFFSIGTNDLTQYTLAMDRGHPRLAPQVDGLHPSVLRLIHLTVEAARRHDRWVGVCGGVAGDPQAVPILVGLGVEELSLSLPLVPTVKAIIRERSLPECRKLAQQALACDTAAQVRQLCPAEED